MSQILKPEREESIISPTGTKTKEGTQNTEQGKGGGRESVILQKNHAANLVTIH